ncbi:uncharacterized protein LOC141640990 [Silene latifolia]|uniref:uncharacterized protein LOC141640990 n=1 Tax=Silene latifolia TaxID=37657 RepID=UPI003D77A493
MQGPPCLFVGPPVSETKPPDNVNDSSIQVEDITDEENENLETQVVDIETKINGVNVGNIAHSMLEGWSVATNCSLHKGGRVLLLWRPTVFDVNIIQYDPQFIHTRILIKATQQVFLLTIVYAFNEGSQRLDLWDNLKSVAGQCDIPWALAGDFNTVLSPEERLGADSKQEDMDTFNDCMSACGMMDIAATCAFFTWTNKQDIGHRKYSRLDRFLVNQEWESQHSFKYFNMWSDAPNFIDTVKSYWSQQIDGTKMFRVVKKLKALKGGLKNLNKECFSDIELNASKASHTLEEIQLQLQDNYDNPDLITLELQALDEVRFWTKARDSFLQQKAKTQWIDEGDSNTLYFHNVIKRRCPRNKIVRLKIEWYIVYRYYRHSKYFPEVLSSLLGEEGDEHVRMEDKAPGPDGYTKGFFKDSWDIVGDEDIIHMYSRKAVTPRCLFKIDLQKAYDTVDWDFVEQMLHGLKFPSHFIQLVMQCVRSTYFTLSLNGNNFGYFQGQRGPRQGDPISPLLFTIYMEYLTRLIKFATDRWPFQYHPLCKNLKLTHLMFADDLLLFCKGKPQSIWLLMRAFSSFSKASGLAMNNSKSEIFFNGVYEDIREGIKQVTGFREGTMPFVHWECLLKQVGSPRRNALP